MKKQISPKIVSLTFGVLVVCFAMAFYVLGWTEPQQVPPGCTSGQPGCDAPINVGLTGQYKRGTLRVAGLTVDSNTYLATTSGNVGIGTAAPNEQLELTGNLRLPKSTATVGIIKSGADRFIHNVGAGNFFAGVNAGSLTMTGTQNTGVGKYALSSITNGDANTAVGLAALLSNTGGKNNTAIGASTLNKNTTGSFNTAVGVFALAFNIGGSDNTAVGQAALTFNKSSDNTAVGDHALYENEAGFSNTAVGKEAGKGVADESFSNSSLFGYQAGKVLTTGSNNILVGYKAGDSITSGANNIIIGYDKDTPLATTSNHLNIGGVIYGDLSTGNVGIGDTIPDSGTGGQLKLDVEGPVGATKYCDENGNNCKTAKDLVSGEWGVGIYVRYVSSTTKNKVYAFCDDNDDIVFGGGCWGCDISLATTLVSSRPYSYAEGDYSWHYTDKKDGWACVWNQACALKLTTYVLCLSR